MAARPREPSIRQATRYSNADIWMTCPSGRRTSDGGWLYPESLYSPSNSTPAASRGAPASAGAPAVDGMGAVGPAGTSAAMVMGCFSLACSPGERGEWLCAARQGLSASRRAARQVRAALPALPRIPLIGDGSRPRCGPGRYYPMLLAAAVMTQEAFTRRC